MAGTGRGAPGGEALAAARRAVLASGAGGRVGDGACRCRRRRAALAAGGGELLENVRLFDVYSGPQVPEGKKSLAFSLRLRAPDRTLTDEDITRVREAALASAAELGAVLRG